MTLSKQTLQYMKSLQLGKFRQKYNNFVAEGDKIVLEIVAQNADAIEKIYAIPSWIANNTRLLAPLAANVQEISPAELKKISGLTTPNQVLAVVQQPAPTLDEQLVQHDLSLYLDGIQDPGNMGTILRIADWFGIRHVFCAPNCVEIYSPKVVQASMGAFLRVHCVESNLSDLKNQFPGLPIFGAVLNGANIFETSLSKQGILVIGNESKGIASEVEALLTHRIAIPASKNGGAESLNAAVATGIIVAVLRNR